MAEKRHHERKDDKAHSTTPKTRETGDPGRTPGTAEGDRANVDKWLKDQGKSEKRGRPQK